MKQQTLAMANGFERYTKRTRRTLFLEEMEQTVPWAELCALVEPVYAKAGNGRPPVGAERMLRIYFLQQWFNLSEPEGRSKRHPSWAEPIHRFPQGLCPSLGCEDYLFRDSLGE
jgi:hypothetical protein